jgi:hypothetical protein
MSPTDWTMFALRLTYRRTDKRPEAASLNLTSWRARPCAAAVRVVVSARVTVVVLRSVRS